MTLTGSHTRSPLGEYLRARRRLADVDPALGSDSSRRVEGLRREEVAERAGISPEYYVRLEQGRGHQPSEQVLTALARALHLDHFGLVHMLSLAAGAPARDRRTSTDVLSHVEMMLRRWSGTPAYVVDADLRIIAANETARLLGEGRFEPGTNIALQFFSPRVRAEQSEWHHTATQIVASLRYTADHAGHRRQAIVAELLHDADFAELWGRHDVAPLKGGRSTHTIGAIGTVVLDYRAWQVAGADGHTLITYSSSGAARSDAALAYLAELARAPLSPERPRQRFEGAHTVSVKPGGQSSGAHVGRGMAQR